MKYGFSKRFSPIAYAILGNKKQFAAKSREFAPHPSREYIRAKVSRKYFDNHDFGLKELMQVSMYKVASSAELFVNPNEYWEYMDKVENGSASKPRQSTR